MKRKVASQKVPVSPLDSVLWHLWRRFSVQFRARAARRLPYVPPLPLLGTFICSRDPRSGKKWLPTLRFIVATLTLGPIRSKSSAPTKPEGSWVGYECHDNCYEIRMTPLPLGLDRDNRLTAIVALDDMPVLVERLAPSTINIIELLSQT